MKKKKVLIVAYNGLGNSGVPKIIFETVLAMHDFCDFDIAVFDKNDHYSSRLIDMGCNIIYIPQSEAHFKGLKQIEWRLKQRNLYLYKYFKNYVFSKKNYDIIHSFKEFDSWPIFKAAKESGVESRILHCNVIQTPPNSLPQKYIFNKGKRLSIQMSTSLVGVSSKCVETAFKKRESTILYNPYDESKYFITDVQKLKEDCINLLHVGNYSKNKNQIFSLRVIKSFIHNKIKARLFIIADGGDAKYKATFLRLIKKFNLKNYITITKSADFESIKDSVHYYILPSIAEGASLVAVECQAQGKTIFASNSLSRDMDVGGIIFLDLRKGAKYWAKKISDYHSTHSQHIKKYDLSRFTRKTFAEQLSTIYGID